MFNNKKKLFGTIIIAVSIFCVSAFADNDYVFTTQKLETNGTICLSEGGTKVIELSDTFSGQSPWIYVKQLTIQAEAVSSRDGATVHVLVNGERKGNPLRIPGTDPSFFVSVGEVTDTIQLTSVSGSVRILSVYAVVDAQAQDGYGYLPDSPIYQDGPGYMVPPSELPVLVTPGNQDNIAIRLASRAISIVDILRDYANWNEFGYFLLPVKKVAGSVLVKASVHSIISREVRQPLILLAQQIFAANDYINETFERSALFYIAVELLSLGHEIDFLLDEPGIIPPGPLYGAAYQQGVGLDFAGSVEQLRSEMQQGLGQVAQPENSDEITALLEGFNAQIDALSQELTQQQRREGEESSGEGTQQQPSDELLIRMGDTRNNINSKIEELRKALEQQNETQGN